MSQEEAGELLDYVDYFKEFIGVMGIIADAAYEGECYEIEAPCRAALHHVETVLGIFLSDHNDGDRESSSPNRSDGARLTVVGKDFKNSLVSPE